MPFSSAFPVHVTIHCSHWLPWVAGSTEPATGVKGCQMGRWRYTMGSSRRAGKELDLSEHGPVMGELVGRQVKMEK